MSASHSNHERLEELLLASATRSLPETERAELNALLRHDAAARAFAASVLTLDALLAECLTVDEARRHHAADLLSATPVPVKATFGRTHWLAKAAAWVGAIHLFGHPAKAASTASAPTGGTLLAQASVVIVMKKAVTSLSAVLLILGGSGIYAIHHHNESSKARVVRIEAEIQMLKTQLGIQSTSPGDRRARSAGSQPLIGITQVAAIYHGDNIITRQEGAILDRFKKQLSAMDAEALRNLILDAEKISDPIHGHLISDLMKELILKDPAIATQLATQLNRRGLAFQFHLSQKAADAFRAWLAKDPAAADAWYVATAAAGGFNSRNIAPNGLEYLAIDRSFARLRFAAQVRSNPAEAAAMMATMVPDDVTSALKEITDPETLLAFLPNLPPERRGPAAEGAIKAIASSDLQAAFHWATSLDMSDRDRSSLLASGIEAAVDSGKLDLAGVSEWSKNLTLDAKRRSDLLVAAATRVSLIPGQNGRIDPNNRVVWDRVAERIDWLRREVPVETSEEMVGTYLGRLAYESHNLEKSLEAYRNEVTRRGVMDPDLTIAFAFRLQLQESDRAKAAALNLLNQLPPGAKRDHAIRTTELNR